jgi:hypothetical protein
VIDLAARVPQESKVIQDVVHYSDDGSALVARLVSESLQPLVQPKGSTGALPNLGGAN